MAAISTVIANVYIDGFNLYYGAVRGTPFRWLNLDKFCQFLLPRYTINEIKYYTALVKADSGNTDKRARQRTYIRALKTLPRVTVVYGQFRIRRITGRTIAPPHTPQCIEKPEEKGSDVNLASHLLFDAFRNQYDTAVIISNDSDLVEPIRIAKQELGKRIVIVNPHPPPARPSAQLHGLADESIIISNRLLGACQFPTIITDVRGSFNKPVTW